VVQEFKPCDSDVVDKIWRDGDRRLVTIRLAPFAITDPKVAMAKYQEYLRENWQN